MGTYGGMCRSDVIVEVCCSPGADMKGAGAGI
jgi:hypothetical protein